jgi:hypothetical protein
MLAAQSAAVPDEHCDRDPCVVSTDDLAPIVSRFVARHKAQYPLVSAYDELAQRSGGVVTSATIRKVSKRTYLTLELYQADAILAAAGRPDALHNGEVSIMGNPRVPKNLRGSCCGGSLNGAISPA